jgi:hypothetical protein
MSNVNKNITVEAKLISPHTQQALVFLQAENLLRGQATVNNSSNTKICLCIYEYVNMNIQI